MAQNVTRRANLPPTNYNLIAIAPWFSSNCTLAYLASASLDPIRAFIFYKPNNSSNQPPDGHSSAWNLNDNGDWRTANRFPIFAVPGINGAEMMKQLSLYSGNISQIPNGDEINSLYGPNVDDYVRIWTELTLHDPSNSLVLWTLSLIVIGGLVLVIGAVSVLMHLVQRRRRKSLRRRVESGEVDLEAMGIKRLTVPASHVGSFPLFTYNAEPDLISRVSTPPTHGGASTRTPRGFRRSRRHDQPGVLPQVAPPPSTRSARSQRSSVGDSVDTTATNDQPSCHICLANFEHRVTIIRELPCGHIFHSDCIDEFLTENSSLCPVCKLCMLPSGYSPNITNGMVRREKALRKLRGRIDLDDGEETTPSRWKMLGIQMLMLSTKPSSGLPLTTVTKKSTWSRGDQSKQPGSSPPDSPKNSTAAAPVGSPQAPSDDISDAPTVTKASRPRKMRSRAVKPLPSQPEDAELKTNQTGQDGPSSFARERMRQLAAKNAPFDDPDNQRPKCKLFPDLLHIGDADDVCRAAGNLQGLSWVSVANRFIGGVVAAAN